jgi:hypothetical protein
MMLMIPKGYESADFAADVQQAATGFAEMQAQAGRS